MNRRLSRLGARELARLISRREISATELATCCLDEIELGNPGLRAFITVDPKQVRKAAEDADAEIAKGLYRGALHGIPVAVKDNCLTAGIRTTFGSRLYADHVPDRDDISVARVKAAGGIVIGKTNLPEFGCGALCVNDLYGPTANPYDRRYSSGGSSGGSAAAVAAGLAPIALGTDFGGSLRTPASFCGVVGFRPTPGRIPIGSGSLPWSSMNVHGTVARSVEDTVMMLESLSGPDASDPMSMGVRTWRPDDVADLPVSKLRVGYSVDLNVSPIDGEVRRIFTQAIRRMDAIGVGAITEEAPDCAGAVDSFETLRAGILYHNYGRLCSEHGGALSPSVVWNVLRGKDLSAAEMLRAESVRARVREQFNKYFENYDILVTVSASVPPFPNTQEDVLEIDGMSLPNIIDYLRVTYVMSLVGFPALSLPFGFTKGGLPVGIQLVARPFEETTLLMLAQTLEEHGFHHVWPPDL
ncbi:MAG TPA: amidase [Nitrobacter sp.]|nr:amidase [Nitrobacter sp.]